jgi:spectrin beta
MACTAQDNFGYELPAVEAAMKKHEAIEADIAAYEERVQGVAELAQALATEGYYDARRVAAQRDSVLRQWALLTGLVGARRTRLEQNLALQKVFQEMVYMVDWMEEMQVGIRRGMGMWVGDGEDREVYRSERVNREEEREREVGEQKKIKMKPERPRESVRER